MSKYLKMAGLILLYLFIYFAVQAVVFIIPAIIYMVKEILSNPGNMDPQVIEGFISKYTGSLLIVSVFAAFPFYLLIFYIRKERFLEVCSLSPIHLRNAGLSALSGVSLGIFIGYLMSYLVNLIPSGKLLPEYEKLMNSIMGGNTVITLVSIGVIGPIFEEILFRGLVFNELKRNIPASAALIIQAVLFGVYHMNLLQGSYAVLVGLLLGFTYLWFKSLWAPILVHVFFNSTNVVLSKIGNQPIVETHGVMFTFISIVVLAGAVCLMWAGRNKLIIKE